MKKIFLAFTLLLLNTNYSFSQNNKKSEAQKIYEQLEKNDKKIDLKEKNKKPNNIKKEEVKKIPTDIIKKEEVKKIPTDIIKKEEVKKIPTDIIKKEEVKKVPIDIIKKEEVKKVPIDIIKKEEVKTPVKNIELENKLKNNIENYQFNSINNDDTQTFIFLFLKRLELNLDILNKILESPCSKYDESCWEDKDLNKNFNQINEYIKKEYKLKIDLYSEDELKYFLMNSFKINNLFGKENISNLSKLKEDLKSFDLTLFKDKIENILNKINEIKTNSNNNESEIKQNDKDNYNIQTILFLFLKRLELNLDILNKVLETDCSINYRLCWQEIEFDKNFNKIVNYINEKYNLVNKEYSKDELKYLIINAFTIYDLLGKENLENLSKMNNNLKELNNNIFKDKQEQIIVKVKETDNKKEEKISLEDYNMIFVSEREGKQALYLFSEKTGKELKISKDDAYDYMPSIFPDKENIIYISENDGNTDIFIKNINNPNPYQITYDSSSKFSPTVSPDGKKVVFVSNRDISMDSTNTVLKINYKIYSMNIDGTEIKKLTDGDYSDEAPRFSPDGNKIVFVSSRDGSKNIYIMNSDGSEQKRLTDDNNSDIMPSWSPDGNKIVFVSNRDKNPEIYIMNSDGSEQKRLTYSYFGSEYPVYSNDGKRIYFASKRDNNIDSNGIRINALYYMNPDGTSVRVIKNSEYNDYQPILLK